MFKRRTWLLCLLVSVALYGNAFAGASLPPHTTEHMLTVDGVERWYRIYKPETFREHNPAVLLLHGGTQSMYRILGKNAGGTNQWQKIADREGLLLIVPNASNENGKADGNKQMWNDLRLIGSKHKSTADDVAFLNHLLDSVIETYKVDNSRIYVTGASNGGMMTYRLLMETPQRFAAAAAFISSLPKDNPNLRVPTMPTPLFILNGTEDSLIKWEGGEIPKRRGNMMSVMENVAWWVSANKADATAMQASALPDEDKNDNCVIHKTTYPAQKYGAEVVFYKADGGGHSMPSRKHSIPKWVKWLVLGNVCRDAEGAELAWEFMKTHIRK